MTQQWKKIKTKQIKMESVTTAHEEHLYLSTFMKQTDLQHQWDWFHKRGFSYPADALYVEK